MFGIIFAIPKGVKKTQQAVPAATAELCVVGETAGSLAPGPGRGVRAVAYWEKAGALRVTVASEVRIAPCTPIR